MGLLTGATSLVELILKKYGDDVAGATEELVRVGGFPESVANRIATGKLPMDAESVAKRAQDQGYGETMLHGSSAGGYNRTHDIKEIDPEKAGDKWGQDREGFFLTNDPVEADYYATTDSMGRTVDGTVYPLKYKSDSPKVISSADDIDLASEQPVGYWDERHGELISEARANGNDSISLLDYGPYEDKSHKMTVVLNPNNIRSPNAAFDPQYTGSNIMGGLALPAAAGLLAAGQSEDADAGFITRGGKTLLEAWHGSPHKFDKFSMDQIGTGEGAQAYGHGLYFADSEDVARQYQNELAGFDELFALDGKPYSYPDNMPVELDPDAYDLAVQNSGRYGKDGAMEKADLMSGNGYSDEWIESYKKYVNEVGDRVEHSKVPNGALYRTEIDVTPESLLDWDKPLSEQSEAVQEIARQVMPELSSTEMQYIPNHGEMTHWTAMADSLEEIPAVEKAIAKLDPYHQGRFAPYGDEMMSTMTGEQFYNSLASPGEWDRQVQGLNRGMTRGEESSGLLSDRGIKGIKYLDGDSRAAGNGTSNYVIFDDGLINIAERGSADPRLLAGTAAGSAGLLAAPLLADKDKPLPVPTAGDILGSVGDVLSMPMTGLQGLARGAYGLLSGEDIATAGAQAANVMGSEHKGLLMTPGMDADKGADALEGWVTEKTGDPSLGWMAKMGLLFGGF